MCYDNTGKGTGGEVGKEKNYGVTGKINPVGAAKLSLPWEIIKKQESTKQDEFEKRWFDYANCEKPDTVYGTAATKTQVGGNHYKNMTIQPIEYIQANGLGYCEGNVVKYVSRWKNKNGVEDLKKARHYLDLLIELEEDGRLLC